MLSAVSQSTSTQRQIDQPIIITLTDAKIKKVILAFLSAVCLVVSYCAFSAGAALSLFIGIPSLTASGILIWSICKIKDYEDPKQLEEYRAEALNLPLERVLDKHGWSQIFKSEILPQEQFNKLYADYVNQLSFKEFITFYEKASVIREKFIQEHGQKPLELLTPNDLKNKFYQEITGKEVCEIFDQYDIEKLHEYDLVSKEFVDAKNEYLKAKKTYYSAIEGIENNHRDHFMHALNTLEQSLQRTNASNNVQKKWTDKLKQVIAYLKRVDPSKIPSDPLLSEGFPGNDIAGIEELYYAYENCRQTWQSSIKSKDHSIAAITENFKKNCSQIVAPFRNN